MQGQHEEVDQKEGDAAEERDSRKPLKPHVFVQIDHAERQADDETNDEAATDGVVYVAQRRIVRADSLQLEAQMFVKILQSQGLCCSEILVSLRIIPTVQY